jgi:GT2 family glycosyltransferase
MVKFNVAIIIVTYNGMPWLDTCLQSCKNHPVIVIDNCSTDASVLFIETNYPNITLLKQSKNLGFGQANNIGIRYAINRGAEHVFLLNQDAYLLGTVLEDLVNFQNQHPEFGILSPIHITDDRKRLDINFSKFMLKEKTGQFYSDFVLGNKLSDVYDVPFVNAAAWLISKKCLQTIGGFDPLFFHYGEDDNYCQRVLFHGFKIGVLPTSYIIHDRENRKIEKLELFSKAYYKNVEKGYKFKYADISSSPQIENKIKSLSRAVIKLQMQFRFKRAKGLKKELTILRSLIPQIEKSRKMNSLKGSHYL